MNFLEIKEKVKDLPEKEVRTYLQHILFRIGMLDDKEYPLEEFSNELRKIYHYILNPIELIEDRFENGNYKKVHILFGYPYLRPALNELKLHEEELILTFYDNFAVGPLANLETVTGQRKRLEWIKSNLEDEEGEADKYLDDLQRAITQLISIPDHVPIHIWNSENAHEQTGLVFTMYLLRERKNNIFIVNTGQVYRELFKKKSTKYNPLFSGEIISEELQTIYQYSQENQKNVTNMERTHFEMEWLTLASSSTTLRIWENGGIKSVSEDYYDEFIIEKAKKLIGKKKGFIKSARLIGEVYAHIFQYIGDSYLEYRVRKLIEKGIFNYEGSLEAMRYYSIKLR
ncbi:DUF1835 domain-containing protein [Neobacillus sp. PS2-9]|uniref:DUF1835 domain-containing protein n=1 Tax=Neobacillus sp. PS2-9 TaxID=3070676 RepID=UPI0027DF1639|nr:DUF1835 domain-containing protein [Neobacillus sp. PS2-9]WML58539.1 DUF1835 domain-containing protein [Neobacillus sp. PS2-9]